MLFKKVKHFKWIKIIQIFMLKNAFIMKWMKIIAGINKKMKKILAY